MSWHRYSPPRPPFALRHAAVSGYHTDLFLLESLVAEFKDQTLTGAVTLDGSIFINVDFNDAELTYKGGVPPGFDNCRFNNSTFSLVGAAGNTVNLLRSMSPATTNMRFVVLGLIPELQN